jgi:hypothetical protein
MTWPNSLPANRSVRQPLTDVVFAPTPPPDPVRGYHLAFGIAASLVLAAMVVAATVLRAEPTTRLVRVVEEDFAERQVA